MRKVSLDTAGMAWDQFFASAKTSVFKCEVLQDYSVVDMGPSLRAWYDGNRQLSIELMLEANATNEWMKIYSARTISKTRVHVVEEPYTPYLEWEIEGYKHSITGEQIFLTPKNKVSHIPIPSGDFWIFDDSTAVEYIYEGPQGNPVGGYIYDLGNDISHLRAVRDSVLKYGQKLDRA